MRIAMVLLLVLGGTACRKKAAPEQPQTVSAAVAAPAPKTVAEAVREVARNFRRVNFAFDSTELVGDSMAALQANAKILQEFPEVRVEVQGHADERGTTEYNLALGQRRAQTVKSRLETMGVPSSRITVVSYGKERPLVSGSSETAWAENRRAEFRVLQGAPAGAAISGTVP
jgi:peptidoglycan-associated lipoprotein